VDRGIKKNPSGEGGGGKRQGSIDSIKSRAKEKGK